jgi:hypothetical protein
VKDSVVKAFHGYDVRVETIFCFCVRGSIARMGSGTLTCVILPVELSRAQNSQTQKRVLQSSRGAIDKPVRQSRGVMWRRCLANTLIKNIEKVRSFSVYDARGERKNIAEICL